MKHFFWIKLIIQTNLLFNLHFSRTSFSLTKCETFSSSLLITTLPVKTFLVDKFEASSTETRGDELWLPLLLPAVADLADVAWQGQTAGSSVETVVTSLIIFLRVIIYLVCVLICIIAGFGLICCTMSRCGGVLWTCGT